MPVELLRLQLRDAYQSYPSNEMLATNNRRVVWIYSFQASFPSQRRLMGTTNIIYVLHNTRRFKQKIKIYDDTKKPFPKKMFMGDDIYWKKETVWTIKKTGTWAISERELPRIVSVKKRLSYLLRFYFINKIFLWLKRNRHPCYTVTHQLYIGTSFCYHSDYGISLGAITMDRLYIFFQK